MKYTAEFPDRDGNYDPRPEKNESYPLALIKTLKGAIGRARAGSQGKKFRIIENSTGNVVHHED